MIKPVQPTSSIINYHDTKQYREHKNKTFAEIIENEKRKLRLGRNV